MAHNCLIARSHGTPLARFDSNAGLNEQRQWWYKYWQRERSAATPVDQGRLVAYDPVLLFLVLFFFVHLWSFVYLYIIIYIYMHVFIYYIYLVMFILFLLFRSSQAVLQNQEICESSGFWKDTLEVVQIIWPVHFWPQVISESRSSFWLQAQGRWGQGLWCILVSPIQTLSSRYKTLRMQDNSRTKAWEKERKKCCVYYSHIGAHNMLQPFMIPWTNTTLFIGPVKWTYILAFTNNFQPHIKSNHTLFSIL